MRTQKAKHGAFSITSYLYKVKLLYVYYKIILFHSAYSLL